MLAAMAWVMPGTGIVILALHPSQPVSELFWDRNRTAEQ